MWYTSTGRLGAGRRREGRLGHERGEGGVGRRFATHHPVLLDELDLLHTW